MSGLSIVTDEELFRRGSGGGMEILDSLSPGVHIRIPFHRSSRAVSSAASVRGRMGGIEIHYRVNYSWRDTACLSFFLKVNQCSHLYNSVRMVIRRCLLLTYSAYMMLKWCSRRAHIVLRQCSFSAHIGFNRCLCGSYVCTDSAKVVPTWCSDGVQVAWCSYMGLTQATYRMFDFYIQLRWWDHRKQ